MKKFTIYLSLIVAMIIVNSCGDNSVIESQQSEIDSLSAEIRYLNEVIDGLQARNAELRDTIAMVSYPASQRLVKAKEAIKDNNLAEATKELDGIIAYFPNSEEAEAVNALRKQIENIREQQRIEAERIEALGFKAIKPKTVVKIDYNTVNLSNISVGNRFVFDSYDDRYFYRDADRGNKYVTMSMSVKSDSKNPRIPQLAIYRINGKTMRLIDTFTTEYARWSDYGCYLGNYHDSRNDFSKVSTVQFKLGTQVESEILNKPYAIVIKNENVLTEQYDRFKNPPQYWTGYASYKQTLSPDDFVNNYTLVKISNL